MSAEERIEAAAAVILDKWENGEASQVGEAEDYGLTDADFETALSRAQRSWKRDEWGLSNAPIVVRPVQPPELEVRDISVGAVRRKSRIPRPSSADSVQ